MTKTYSMTSSVQTDNKRISFEKNTTLWTNALEEESLHVYCPCVSLLFLSVNAVL